MRKSWSPWSLKVRATYLRVRAWSLRLRAWSPRVRACANETRIEGLMPYDIRAHRKRRMRVVLMIAIVWLD